jgi:tRNA (mo5U34)-methyltransferase
MQLEFRALPSHPNLKIGISFADWDRKAVNGNSVGMFIWISSENGSGRPHCQELLLRDGDHCIARVSTFHETESVLSKLCPSKVDSSIFAHLCINRLILRKQGSISVLIADEFGVRHHLGTIHFKENTFTENEKPTFNLGVSPILISSLGRSGSTVLANSIGLHPEVCLIGSYPFEYRFFSYCLHATYITTSPANHDCSMGPDAFEKVNLFNTGFNPYNSRGFDRLLVNDNLRDFYETKFTCDTTVHFMEQAKAAIERITATKKTATAFIEKAVGSNLSNLAENIFPNLKEIVLMRNFWDMALSMIAFDVKRGTTSFYSENPDDWLIARAYQHCNLTIRSRLEGKIPVLYEDLIKNPKLCLTKLVGKLGLKQDKESIDAMLVPFTETPYLDRHKTDQNKKSEIRKWFSDEAVQAAEILLEQCRINKKNTSFELATWIGDINTTATSNDTSIRQVEESKPASVNWFEAFSWATNLNETIRQQNNLQQQLEKESLKKIHNQYKLDTENYTKGIASLTENLNAIELRAELAEKYAKTLDVERARLENYIRSREATAIENEVRYQLEIKSLRDSLMSELATHSDRASRAELYSKSLEVELEKHKKIIVTQQKGFDKELFLLRERLFELEKSNNSYANNENSYKASQLESEKQILNLINRTNLAEEYAKSLESERLRIYESFANEHDLRTKNEKLHTEELRAANERIDQLQEHCSLFKENTYGLKYQSLERRAEETNQIVKKKFFKQFQQIKQKKGVAMNQAEAEQLVNSFSHWHHKFEIFPNVFTPGSYNPKFLLDKLGLPADLAGKRVLDIGACDGYFSLELLTRGAHITALDYRPKTESGFAIMEKIKGVQIPHIVSSIYDINKNIGSFDIVLLLGVIYHLPDISSALWRLRKICKGTIFVESYVEDFGTEQPMARYYEAANLNGDGTNFWAPNLACMESMLRDCGFIIKNTHRWGDRALVEAEANGSDTKMALAYGTFNSKSF